MRSLSADEAVTAAAAEPITADASFLVVVDLQTQLLPVLDGPAELLRRSAALVAGAQLLHVPIWFTEQNPAGLGRTSGMLTALAPGAEVLEKTHFDALAEDAAATSLGAAGRGTAVVAGAEAHVCVMQTCLGLIAKGYRVAVVGDAVSSRRSADRDAALARLSAAGAVAVTVEMVLFEWLGHADGPAFAELRPLIRDLVPRQGSALGQP